MNEHSFIRSIHTKISSDVFVWKIADKYQGGVPDTFYSGLFGYMFIEYKYQPTLPKRLTSLVKLDLSQLQRAWLTRAQSHNHLAYIVLGSEAGVYITNIMAQKHVTLKELKEASITKKEFVSRINMVCSKKETTGLL